MPDRVLTSSAALAEALHEEMRRDETVFIIGEDLVAHAGIFGTVQPRVSGAGSSIVRDSLSWSANIASAAAK